MSVAVHITVAEIAAVSTTVIRRTASAVFLLIGFFTDYLGS